MEMDQNRDFKDDQLNKDEHLQNFCIRFMIVFTKHGHISEFRENFNLVPFSSSPKYTNPVALI